MEHIHENISQEQATARSDYRDRIELLRRRVSLLAGKDRLLMTMYLENGNSFRQIARLSGVSEGNISRRIRRVTWRLLDGEYITCLRNRDKFSKTELAIAKEHYLSGLSMKKVAERQQLSYYRVHKTLERIRGLIKNK